MSFIILIKISLYLESDGCREKLTLRFMISRRTQYSFKKLMVLAGNKKFHETSIEMYAVMTLRGLVLVQQNLAAPKETGMDQKAI